MRAVYELPDDAELEQLLRADINTFEGHEDDAAEEIVARIRRAKCPISREAVARAITRAVISKTWAPPPETREAVIDRGVEDNWPEYLDAADAVIAVISKDGAK